MLLGLLCGQKIAARFNGDNSLRSRPMNRIICIILLSFLIAIPTKSDFSKAFVSVAKIANPSVVSIVTEKTFTNQSPFFFDQQFLLINNQYYFEYFLTHLNLRNKLLKYPW